MSRRTFAAAALGALGGGASSPAPAAARPERPLFAAFPRLAATLPRVELTALPTPIARAERLGEALSLPLLYVKRDDQSALPYGGGKPRKLEFFFGEALRLGRTRVATVGGVGSNHTLATALYAQRLGLATTLLLLPEPPSAAVRRKLSTLAALGATLRPMASQAAAERELGRLAASGTDTYVIAMGGSAPLGNVGFIDAGLELAAQVRSGLVPEPERIYLPLGTMGSAVGLLLGLELAGLRTHLVAVRASNPGTSSFDRFSRLYASTLAFLRERDPTFPLLAFPKHRFTLEGAFLGAGYGRPTRSGARAERLALETQGIVLEPTYSAKTLAALERAAPELGARPILFWLTHSAAEPSYEVDPKLLPPALRGYLSSH